MKKKQTQAIDLRPGKRFSSALGNENLRIGDKTAWAANVSGTLDPTRSHLNFEIGKGGVVMEIDKSRTVPRRIKEILDAHGIKDPNIGLSNEDLKQNGVGRRTFATFILQGSHDTMRRLAFGNQAVDYDNPNADNSHVERRQEIELWAKDMYDYIARKFGEDNIAEFVAHLDETNPHVHCVIVPVIPSGKLSFRKMFVGEKNDKYEFSKKTRAIWDDAAAIANKYGMERGDDKMTTGAKHKSYLQWMREKIFDNMKKIEEQDEIISRQAAEITDKKQQLYAMNGEIRMAERKLKGLTTMLRNLNEQREAIEIDIVALEEERENGNEEAAKKIMELNEKLNGLNAKILERNSQIADAREQLRDLAIKKHKLQNEYESQKRLLNKELPDLLDKVQGEVNDAFWELAAEEMKKDYSAFEDFARELPDSLRARFQKVLEGSFFEDVAQRGEHMAAVGAALFLGYLDAATQIAQSGGGGGSPDTGWGRNKDEDDESFRRRCCIMGRMMMKPAGRQIMRKSLSR
ncbi:MAG: plasmid recombination protein [Prevotella sp.]|nr:plasmid recombination protein [Prevotella sp.]